MPVAGIAQARQDVAVLVQALVNRREVDRDVRMGGVKPLDSFRSANQTDKLDLGNTPLLEDVHRSNCRAAGCQHGVKIRQTPTVGWMGRRL